MLNFSFLSTNHVLHHVIIGQLLGGANITRRSDTRNSYFRVGFGPNFQTYACWLCEYFGDITNKGVVTRMSNSFLLYEFQTKTLPIFNYYHSLFYLNGTKVLPANVDELMSPIVLAHLIMSIGHYSSFKQIIEINLYSYNHNDCSRLANAIMSLHSVLSKQQSVRVIKQRVGKLGEDQYCLVITGPAAKSIIQDMVKPHMHESMLYRVGLS